MSVLFILLVMENFIVTANLMFVLVSEFSVVPCNSTVPSLDWIGLSSVLRPRQHSIGYMGDGQA